MRDPLGFLERLAREYGDIVEFKLGRKTVVLLNNPELIQDVLVANSSKFEKGVAGRLVKLFLGDSLLTSQGTAHRRQRRLVQPAFHRTRLAGYAKIVTEYGQHATDTWRDGEMRDIAADMAHLTLEVIGRALFSTDVRHQTDDVSRALTTFLENIGRMQFPGAMWLLRLPLPFSRRFRAAQKTLDEIIYGMIRLRRTTGADAGDLLSMLLLAEDADQVGEKLSDTEVRDQCMTLFLAGHETAAHALSWTWWLLAQHPIAEATLHSELASVLAGRTPSLADIPKLKFTECVIRESMRLYPPAWALGRMTLAEHELAGYRIRPGTLVLVSQWVTHRDHRFFPNPNKFQPERWTSEFRENLPRCTYFPFGAGARMCIGENFASMELLLLIAEIAQHWRFECTPETKAVPQPRITLRPRGELRLRVHRRKE